MAYEQNVKRLSRLFDRRNDRWGARSSRSSARMIASLIDVGRLSVRAHRLPMSACGSAATIPPSSSGESTDHRRMKRAAMEWMRSEGATDAKEEVLGYTGKFDVYSADADWIVECGNSDMGKLLDAIRDDERPRFTLIPYQATEWRDGSHRRLIAVDFVGRKRSDEHLDWLLREQARAEAEYYRNRGGEAF